MFFETENGRSPVKKDSNLEIIPRPRSRLLHLLPRSRARVQDKKRPNSLVEVDRNRRQLEHREQQRNDELDHDDERTSWDSGGS